MQKTSLKAWLALAVILVAGIAAFWYFAAKKEERSKKPESPPVRVAVSPVIERDSLIEIESIGNIQPYATINVRSLVDGQLQFVGFKEGEIVQKDQILFKIDPRPFEVQLQQAQANLVRDEAQLANAVRMVDRAQTLRKEKYFSQQEFDQLQTNVAVLKGTLEVDKAAVAAAKLQLDYCVIKAPATGFTGNLQFNIGNIIQAKDAKPLIVINQIVPIYAVFSVPEQYLVYIQKNMTTGLTDLSLTLSDDENKEAIKATLTFINNTVDPNTGTIQLKATIPNEDKRLWPGQFVNIKMPLYDLKNAKLIPSRAIQAGAEGFHVFVITKGNTVETRQIKVGPILDDESVVLQGLAKGELVVTAGQLKLTDGTKVNFDAPAKPIVKPVTKTIPAKPVTRDRPAQQATP